MRIKNEYRTEVLKASLAEIENDIVIKNALIVNVFTGEVLEGHIGIYKGFITDVEYETECTLLGKEVFDYENKMYALPGFIDSHVHIESSMMTPRNYCKTVLPHGITTIVSDPHEIANVLGVQGVKYMIECSKDLPMKQYVLAPSCVPAVLGFEDAGATFYKEEIAEILEMDNVLGIAEVMDFVGVINNETRMKEILELAIEKNVFIQGHAPVVKGKDLSAYLVAGVESDHENLTEEEVIDKYRKGLHIDCRETSIAKNTATIINYIKTLKFKDNLSFCTDDREVEDLLSEGSLNYVVNTAIKCGLDPVEAIKSATFNAARVLGIKNVGAIAPGYTADIIITETIDEIIATSVFSKGLLAAQDGVLKIGISEKDFDIENTNTIDIPDITEESFKIKANKASNSVIITTITSIPGSPFTKQETAEVEVKDGYIDLSNNPELKFVAVINRHGKKNISLGIVKNYGLNNGTVGSSVSHDSHNLTIVYDNPGNALLCTQEIKNNKGGIACCIDGKVIASLKLEVAGLMSKTNNIELAEQTKLVKDTFRQLGISGHNPFGPLFILALPVIPEIAITDLGLVNVDKKEFVPLIVD